MAAPTLIPENSFFNIGPKPVPSSLNELPRAAGTEYDNVIPATPFVIVQFRTGVYGTNGANDERDWTDVSARIYRTGTNGGLANGDQNTFMQGKTGAVFPTSNANIGGSPFDQQNNYLKFDNHFESIELEDNGGLIKCTLRLFDKDVYNLENIIAKAIAKVSALNEAINGTGDTDNVAVLQAMRGGTSAQNLRVKFGYADFISGNASGGVINLRDSSDEFGNCVDFEKRVLSGSENKMVMCTPWIYFMMTSANFALIDKGLTAEVVGLTTGATFMERVKLVKRKWNLKGSPTVLLKNIGCSISAASGATFNFIDWTNAGNVIIGGSSKADNAADYTNATIKNDQNIANLKSEEPISFISDEYVGTGGKTQDTNQKSVFNGKPCPLSSTLTAAQQESFEYWKNQISISLGGESECIYDKDGKVVFEKKKDGTDSKVKKTKMDFITVSQILSEYCSKVPSIFYIADGTNKGKYLGPNDGWTPPNTSDYITNDDYKKVLNGTADMRPGFYVPYRYNFEIIQSNGNIYVRFYYEKHNTNQPFVRAYTFRNSPKSIIKALSAKSEIDFAQLSTKVLSMTTKDGVLKYDFGGTGVQKDASGKDVDAKAVVLKNATADLINKLNAEDGFSFVQQTSSESNPDAAGAFRTNVIANLNQNLFKGTVELMGDPFYLFDKAMSPAQYFINIDVYRPRPATTVGTAPLDKSYLSGQYRVMKIKHTIDINGFKTSLDILKAPE